MFWFASGARHGWCPEWNEFACAIVETMGDRRHEFVAKQPIGSRYKTETYAEGSLDASEVVGCEFANRLSHAALVDFALTNDVDEFACIDFDRA